MKIELTDQEIAKLIQDTFSKIEVKGINDTKILSEMNSSLNWILTISAILFTLNNKIYTVEPSNNELILIITSRIIFFIMAFTLITHKILLVSYEQFKFEIFDILRNIALDLQTNTYKAKTLFDFSKPFQTLAFSKVFRNGGFCDDSDKEKFLMDFEEKDKRIMRYKRLLSKTFRMCIYLCIIYLLLSAITWLS